MSRAKGLVLNMKSSSITKQVLAVQSQRVFPAYDRRTSPPLIIVQ